MTTVYTQTQVEAEKSVLGVCIANSAKVGALAGKGVTRAFFYVPAHQMIWDVLVELSESKAQFNLVDVMHRMERAGTLDGVGGHAGLTEIATGYSYLFSFDSSVELLVEGKRKRDILDGVRNLNELAMDATVSSEALLAATETMLTGIRKACGNAEVKRLGSASEKVVDDLEFRMQHPGAVRGLTTGMPSLDCVLDGLQPGAMVVIGARPGVGKTSILVNMLEHLATSDPAVPVGMISLEMPNAQLLERVLFSRAHINAAALRKGAKLTQRQGQEFTRGLKVMRDAPFYIADKSAMTISEIQAVARQMVNEYGIRCLGVDYLQLARGTSRQGVNSREREVSEVSAGLKAIAKDLGIPVIVLAQLNRDVTKRGGAGVAAVPKVSDLRDSGSIEQDADQVLLLHRPSPEDVDADQTQAVLIVGKNRFGIVCNITLKWDAAFTRYREA